MQVPRPSELKIKNCQTLRSSLRRRSCEALGERDRPRYKAASSCSGPYGSLLLGRDKLILSAHQASHSLAQQTNKVCRCPPVANTPQPSVPWHLRECGPGLPAHVHSLLPAYSAQLTNVITGNVLVSCPSIKVTKALHTHTHTHTQRERERERQRDRERDRERERTSQE
jgi:hypothetical protein